MSRVIHTSIGIIGAGPAGLALAARLRRAGVEAVVLEARSRDYCVNRARAGLLEPGTVDFLCDLGLDRVRREGIEHDGLQLHFRGERHRIPIAELTGRSSTIYRQQEVVKDLLADSDAGNGTILFEATDIRLDPLHHDGPRIAFTHEEEPCELRCTFIAGCDGFLGASRASLPQGAIRQHEKAEATTLFGVLADVPPTTDDLVYGLTKDGFTMHSMRTTTLTRLYFQYDPGKDDPTTWEPERIWEELATRLSTADGWDQPSGPIIEAAAFPIRAFLAEPMRHGPLFLAGDAAHIVPPTGGKGLNAAVWDVALLSEAFVEFFESGRTALLDSYSDQAVARAWRMLQFSVWMTRVLSIQRAGDAYELELKYAELEQLCSSETFARSFAERYIGHF